MSLRSQVAGVSVALTVLLVLAVYSIQTQVVMPAFVELENTLADRNVSRCVDALQHDLDSISNTTNDWASWDETYEYIADRNPRYVSANLTTQTFTNTHFNLICIVDEHGRIVWGEARDFVTAEPIDVPDLFDRIKDPAGSLTVHKDIDDSKEGIIVTSRGPILLASRPIITTQRQGPTRGSLLMGRFLTHSEISGLAERVHVKLSTWTIGHDMISPELQHVVDECAASGESVLQAIDDETLCAYRVVNDLYGRPAVLLRVDVPREVTMQGRVSTGVAAACSLVGGVLILALLWMVLQRRIVEPLRFIATHAERVGQTGDLKARLHLSRADEIGTLATEFDRMVENLAESRKIVLDAAHRSGMSEVASEVLHNVGNAVNSANCAVELLSQRLQASKSVGLGRALALLEEHKVRAAEFFSSDPRGPKLLDYLGQVNESLQQEHQENRSDVTRLIETIRHIRDVILAQQNFTGQSDFRQEVALPALMDEVLLLCGELLADSRVELEVDLPPLPELTVNKSKLSQVLVNLVRNACQAMQGQAGGRRVLSIAARVFDEDGIEIAVGDTGRGFDGQVRAKLFTHGFTTRPKGNGFGLHYCANAVISMGGTITAESEGPGRGATFTVRLVQVIPSAAAASKQFVGSER